MKSVTKGSVLAGQRQLYGAVPGPRPDPSVCSCYIMHPATHPAEVPVMDVVAREGDVDVRIDMQAGP